MYRDIEIALVVDSDGKWSAYGCDRVDFIRNVEYASIGVNVPIRIFKIRTGFPVDVEELNTGAAEEITQ